MEITNVTINLLYDPQPGANEGVKILARFNATFDHGLTLRNGTIELMTSLNRMESPRLVVLWPKVTTTVSDGESYTIESVKFEFDHERIQANDTVLRAYTECLARWGRAGKRLNQ